MVKRVLILSFFAMVWLTDSKAQQIALTNLYSSNYSSINPAYSSISEFNAVQLNSRNQWTDLNKNPTTTFVSGNYSFDSINGVGGNFYIDQVGAIRQMYTVANYSHSFKIQGSKFSLGIGLGVHQNRIKFDDVIAEDYSDVVLQNNSNAATTYLTDMGIMYQYNKFILGISSPRVIPSAATTTNFSFGLARQVNVISSYKIKYNQNITIVPSVLVRSVTFKNYQYDANVDVDWYGTFSLGIGYRDNTAFMIRGTLMIGKKIEVGYSNEKYINRAGALYSTQEFGLSYKKSKHPEPEDPELEIPDNNLPSE